MPASHRRHRLLMAFCWCYVVFLVLLPKGGFKIGPAPITWGYLLLAVTTPVLFVVRLLALPLRFPLRLILAAASLIPILCIFSYAAAVNGVLDPASAASIFLNMSWLPAIFLFVFPPFLPMVDGEQFSRYFRFCILGAALWGILLFVLHPITGHFIEIPYVTVNVADYGQLENTKHINRGIFLKLISTYNNGNIYGVATLMLLPLYDLLETVRWRRLTVKLALLLTLSRTVWFGMLVYEAIPLVEHFGGQLRNFPIIHIGVFRRRLIAFAVTCVLIVAAVPLVSGANLSFLFDPTAGGRIGQITSLQSITWLPSHPMLGFGEIVYATALSDYGILGLFALLLVMASPLLLLLVDRSALSSPTRHAALHGVLLYAVVAVSDGGFVYIPIFVFYWFTYMIYLFGWPGTELSGQPSKVVMAPTTQHTAATQTSLQI